MKDNSKILGVIVGLGCYNYGSIEVFTKFPKEQEYALATITLELYERATKDIGDWKQSIYTATKNDLTAESLFESKGVTPTSYYTSKRYEKWK